MDSVFHLWYGGEKKKASSILQTLVWNARRGKARIKGLALSIRDTVVVQIAAQRGLLALQWEGKADGIDTLVTVLSNATCLNYLCCY